jgi:alpha-D-ribose 1-methylphosphonate 5-triphosphate synthase subunit PhnG
MTRAHWLSILAKSPQADLERLWTLVADKPAYRWLRRPEVGLVMVRARTGGTGDRFNLGEMTVTRCALRLTSGAHGVGYVAGRDPRKAEVVALIDALLQEPTRHDDLLREVIAPLERGAADRAAAMAAKVRSTKVDFFTLVRGAT